ncbi:hypothetical protein JOF29_004407 [Kribbella aluminosa]|uniref:Uncharacterized protein n=1 Tax=Kribbella aluminosa TaxID=416017 RepID=A0ABS4UNT2_9ACTN|nr:hypothetical protein [Kribbella aluminosa]MBP2353297.1 hypothetical protein [Kribbella aluminosa]
MSRDVDTTKPLLLGYIPMHLLMTDAELDAAKQQLEAFADVEGFALNTIYVERVETTPAAFQALVESVNRYEATAVVVPSLTHLTSLGPQSMKDHLEHYTRARVLIPASPP